MRQGVTFVANDRLGPPINWSTLGPPVSQAFERRGATVAYPTRPLARSVISPRAEAVRKVRSARDLFWMQLSARPEPQVAALAAWAPRARRSVYVVDPWPYVLPRVVQLVKGLRVTHCFVSFREAYDTLREQHPDLPFHHLPFGVDTEVFEQQPGDTRDIFAFWMGRSHAPLHDALTRYCRERGLRFESSQNGSIRDPAELGRMVGRSRYFVVTPPDLDHPERTGGFSPFVMRYLEGLSAGARLLGVEPRSGEFEQMLPRRSILTVRPDGSDLAARLDADADDAEAWVQVDAARQLVRAEHGWSNRVDRVLGFLGSAGAGE